MKMLGQNECFFVYCKTFLVLLSSFTKFVAFLKTGMDYNANTSRAIISQPRMCYHYLVILSFK